MTGTEYIDSIDDEREIYIYGERVKKATEHPAFRNSARMLARLYDALHDPAQNRDLLVATDTGTGGKTHAYFRPPRSVDESLAGRDAVAAWQRLTYGWLGRSPDYKAAFLATLGANRSFYTHPQNAQRWYEYSQNRIPYVNHAILHPPIDRDHTQGIHEACVHVVKETAAGLVVSGAKTTATGSALTNFTFVAQRSIPVQDKRFACVFMVPSGARGVKFICRPSYEMTSAVMGSPFDYPLSSRMDENDAVLVLDEVLIAWENVFIYGDLETAITFIPRTGFLPRALLHGCTRLAVKLDLIAGCVLKAVEAAGTQDSRAVQAHVGDVIAWRNLFWALSEAMVRSPTPWVNGYLLPNEAAAGAYQLIATIAYPEIKHTIEQACASGLMQLSAPASDFNSAHTRKYLERYLCGANGYDAVNRAKVMRLLWDAIGSEFGARHELYEINYSGSTEEIRRHVLFTAMASGEVDKMTGFAEQCMAEYDLDGWVVPDLINPGELSHHR